MRHERKCLFVLLCLNEQPLPFDEAELDEVMCCWSGERRGFHGRIECRLLVCNVRRLWDVGWTWNRIVACSYCVLGKLYYNVDKSHYGWRWSENLWESVGWGWNGWVCPSMRWSYSAGTLWWLLRDHFTLLILVVRFQTHDTFKDLPIPRVFANTREGKRSKWLHCDSNTTPNPTSESYSDH